MTHIRMILKHLCLAKNSFDFEDKFCSHCYVLFSLIFPNFDVKSIIFYQFWPGAYSQICIKPFLLELLFGYLPMPEYSR